MDEPLSSDNSNDKKQVVTTNNTMMQQHPRWLWPLIVIVLLLLLLLLAMYFHWGPFKNKVVTPATSTSTTSQQSSGSGTQSTTGSGATGATGAAGSAGTNGTTTPATTSPILNFSTTINNGDTKETISGQSSGLTQSCTVTVDSTTAGKQEVCAYSDGNKIVTVNYLNGRATSISRSGF